MELEEFYKQVGGNFEDVKRRLLNEEFIRKFVLKFKDDETFDNLIDAFTTPRSTRPVATVPRPEMVMTSSMGIRKGLSSSRSGLGM